MSEKLLSEASIGDLIDELATRTEALVIGILRPPHEESKDEEFMTLYEGKMLSCIGLAHKLVLQLDDAVKDRRDTKDD